MTGKRRIPATDQTDIGAQYVVDGVRPVSIKDKLEVLATKPMKPKRLCVQKPCDIGLFDEDARNQFDLF